MRADDFGEVSAYLDKGGDYFEFSRPALIREKIAEFFYEIKSSVATLDLDEEQRPFIYGVFDVAEAAIEYLGFKEIDAIGRSSIALNDQYYRNRAFYLIRQPAKGILWNIVSTKNISILENIGEMPMATTDAFVIDVDFTQIVFQQELNRALPPSWQETLQNAGITQELANSLSGRWQILLFPQNGFLMIVPDPQKKAYALIQNFLEPNCEVTENGALIKGDFTIGHTEGWLVVAKNIVLPDDDAPTIKNSDFFQQAVKTLPADGIAAYYSAVPPEPETLDLFGIPLNLAATQSNQLGVVRREKNGFSISAVSDMTIPCENVMTAINLFCRALALISETMQDEVIQEAENQHQLCQQNLQTIYAALSQYRAKNGRFPQAMQENGWRELTQTSPLPATATICPDSPQAAQENATDAGTSITYIYFGDWGDFAEDAMPLVIDFPGNHTESFNVLYSDGSVATLETEGNLTVRKAASLLHTINRYDEAHFIELMRRAAEIDQQLNLE